MMEIDVGNSMKEHSMEIKTDAVEAARAWEPMRLSYVSNVGDLMRNTLGSRRDNSGGTTCPSGGRQVGGTGSLCA